MFEKLFFVLLITLLPPLIPPSKGGLRGVTFVPYLQREIKNFVDEMHNIDALQIFYVIKLEVATLTNESVYDIVVRIQIHLMSPVKVK
jgi:hypothetical protein